MSDLPLIAVTAGDISGIGPEVALRAICDPAVARQTRCALIGHPQIFRNAMDLIGVQMPLHEMCGREIRELFDRRQEFRHRIETLTGNHQLLCLNPCRDDVLNAPRGQVSAISGDAAFCYLHCAILLARSSVVDAIVTAPLNKESLHLAGHRYPGHTEILAEQCGVRKFAMMLHLPESSVRSWRQQIGGPQLSPICRDGLSIAHVTLHTSIASVPSQLTQDGVIEKILLMSDFLKRIGCKRRSIAVCALNPHGGENGLFGNEEIGIISPAVAECRSDGIHVSGPFPVDTLIRRSVLGEFDGIIAMYHDQGHIPVKLMGFDSAINITLGLPIVRTSPTHGTAFDRAWNPEYPADGNGMKEAILMAARMAGHGASCGTVLIGEQRPDSLS